MGDSITVELPEVREFSKRDPQERFMEKVVVSSDGCWLWQGYVRSSGYGEFSLRGRNQLAHRVAFELFKFPPPRDLQVDHTCGVRSCVNPEHLDCVSASVNTHRSEQAPAALNKRKTHCLRGHPLSGDNLYIKPNGRRVCRTCKNDEQRTRRACG